MNIDSQNTDKTMNVSVKLYGKLPEKLQAIMKIYDMRQSDALRFLINRGYEIFVEDNKNKNMLVFLLVGML